MPYDETLAERVRTLLGRKTSVREKRMFGGLAFMVRGHMAVGVQGQALMVRVGPDAYGALLREPHAREMDFSGRALRGFLYVDPPGVAGRGLARWVARALAFNASQPPK